jgi:serine/threonine-protein kinase SRPK3
VDARVIISDFGEAFFQDEERKESHAPILLLPPEVFFHGQLGPTIDVWTLGCTLYETLGEYPLLEGFRPDQDHVSAEMVSTMGHLPNRWWDRWQQRTDYFLEVGSWKTDTYRSHAPYSRSLAERLRIMGRGEDPATCEFSPKETACLEKVLRAMLIFMSPLSASLRARRLHRNGWREGVGERYTRPALARIPELYILDLNGPSILQRVSAVLPCNVRKKRLIWGVMYKRRFQMRCEAVTHRGARDACWPPPLV